MSRHRKRKHRAGTDSTSGSSSSGVSEGKTSDSKNSKNTPKKQKVVTSTPTSARESLSKFAFVSKSVEEDIMAEKGDDPLLSTSEDMNAVFSPNASANPVQGVSNEDLMRKLCANGSAITKLSATVEELRAALLLVQNDNDKLKKEVGEAKQREETLRDQLSEVRHLADVADRRAEEVSAYVRRNNLRIYGVKEEQGETAQQCEEKALSLITNKLKVMVKPEDIEAVHRVGAREQRPGGASSGARNTGRAIIMRFVSRRIRDAVLYARKKLKGSGTVIVEDLTPRAYSLLCSVKSDTSVCQQAWTKYGTVWMKMTNGRIVSVRSLADFRQHSSQAQSRSK